MKGRQTGVGGKKSRELRAAAKLNLTYITGSVKLLLRKIEYQPGSLSSPDSTDTRTVQSRSESSSSFPVKNRHGTAGIPACFNSQNPWSLFIY